MVVVAMLEVVVVVVAIMVAVEVVVLERVNRQHEGTHYVPKQ